MYIFGGLIALTLNGCDGSYKSVCFGCRFDLGVPAVGKSL